jgi:Fe-S-cluster-containing hydrogenase component 2
VCLIGCPVGSIHKGGNGQIVIEDWCIGCSRCALNCPYDAIQMHTIGVIPRSSFGWRVDGPLRAPNARAERVLHQGATPYYFDRDFRQCYVAEASTTFSRVFDLDSAEAKRSKAFLLHVESSAGDVRAVVNGKAIELRKLDDKEAKQKAWNFEAMLAHVSEPTPQMLPGEAPPQATLRSGRNEIGIQMTLASAKYGEVLLDVGLTGYVPPVVDKSVAGDEYKQDWVMNTAVVCDMCSGQFGQQPACVNACPHEAASRQFVTYETFLAAK